VPHPQAAEVAIPHLCKQEQKNLAPVWRRLNRSHAVSCAYKNFVQGGQLSDVLPVGPSVYFQRIEKFAMGLGLRPHSGYDTARCSWRGRFRDERTESRSVLQLFNIPPHFCFCRQMNSWASEGQGMPCPPWILKLSVKNVIFWISRGKKQISPLLPPPEKFLGKSPTGPPRKNPFDAHGWTYELLSSR